MSKVSIIYSTVGGNTEMVCKKVSDVLSEAGLEVKMKRVDVSDMNDLALDGLTILASPTYGQGTVEDHFKPFLKELKKTDITGKKFAVIGLGNTKYYPEYLTEAGTILESFLKEKEAEIIYRTLKIGTNPLGILDSLVTKWAKGLAEKIS